MWVNHEENVDHPEGSEYPVSVNVPFLKLMRERVANSILSRTGIDIRDYDKVIHATTSPAIDKDGNIMDHAGSNLVRNV
jgi:hypothetical protein